MPSVQNESQHNCYRKQLRMRNEGNSGIVGFGVGDGDDMGVGVGVCVGVGRETLNG